MGSFAVLSSPLFSCGGGAPRRRPGVGWLYVGAPEMFLGCGVFLGASLGIAGGDMVVGLRMVCKEVLCVESGAGMAG